MTPCSVSPGTRWTLLALLALTSACTDCGGGGGFLCDDGSEPNDDGLCAGPVFDPQDRFACFLDAGCVTFRDPALVACIRGEGGPPDGGVARVDGGQVSCNCQLNGAAVEEIAELRCPGRGVFDLTGVEEMTQLHTLDVSNNDVVNLGPLASAPSLRTVRLGHNRITNLAALADTLLTHLDVSSNAIIDFQVFAERFTCPNATAVDLTGNPLDRDDNADLARLIGKGCVVTPTELP
ncbi:MAG: leucine-rich repeat domain-containing protein [Myxococcota bacterium]